MNVRACLRRVRSDEQGVVIVLVALLMTVFIALAALAIDIGSFQAAQRKAQAAADAGALAGAAALSTSTTAATTAATALANTNDPTGTAPVVSFPSSTQVKVVVTANPPTFFGRALGLTKETVGASAVAGTNSTVAQCTSAGTSCLAVFAKDTSCTTAPLTLGGLGSGIQGGIISNGSVSATNGGNQYPGLTDYGNGSGCFWHTGGGDTFASGTPTSVAPLTNWPIDYSADFPPCSGSSCTGACDVSTTPCPAANKTPSFCTQGNATTASSENLVSYNPYTLTSGNIYCDVGNGTGVLASDPTTWNGAITANVPNGTTIESSYVAGSVTLAGGGTNVACGASASGYAVSGCDSTIPAPSTFLYPVVYAVGTGTAVSTASGGVTIDGDIFAPNGTINIGGGGGTTFLEGFDVSISNGGTTLSGDGPKGYGTSGSGGVSLLQ
jgi:Flp pilus assembly protein TadG